MTRRIAAIDAGTYYHHEGLHGPRYRDFFERIVYARDPLPRRSGRHRRPPRHLPHRSVAAGARRRPRQRPARPRRDDSSPWARRGRTCGSTGVEWTDGPTNFWWWTEPGGDLGLVQAAPDHPFFAYVPFRDTIWHHHGTFALARRRRLPRRRPRPRLGALHRRVGERGPAGGDGARPLSTIHGKPLFMPRDDPLPSTASSPGCATERFGPLKGEALRGGKGAPDPRDRANTAAPTSRAGRRTGRRRTATPVHPRSGKRRSSRFPRLARRTAFLERPRIRYM